MELFVATWTIRLTLVGALAVGVISVASGSLLQDAVLRAAFVAFVFTLGGRLLIGVLETPEQRIARLRRQRAGRAGTPAAAADTRSGRQMARPMSERAA